MDTQSEFTPRSSQQPHGNSDVRYETVAGQLSGPLIGLAGTAVVSGLSYGFFKFLQRSPVRQAHAAGTAAWWPHLGLALAAIAILALAGARHRRRFGVRSGRLWLLAPFGVRAQQRIARAFGSGGEAAHPVRLVLALPATALFLFCFWRAGAQVTGGLDPNFTVNAWGGPTYVGALACHLLDLSLIVAAAAWLIDRILPA